MDKRTLTALEGSIAKWEAIVAGTEVDRGVDNCPLCREFSHIDDPDTGDMCCGCPVSDRTGQSDCCETPYIDFANLLPWKKSGGGRDKATTPEQIAAAQAEVDFLKSLLPLPQET